MTRVLVTTHSITGHVRYAIPLVRELIADGHQVLWYTGPLFEPLVVKAGAQFAPMTARTGFDSTEADALHDISEGGNGLRAFGDNVLRLFVKPIPSFMADMEDLFDSFEPDVLVADHTFMAGVLLAEQRGLPRVAFSTGALSVPSVDTAPFGTGLQPASGPLGQIRNRLLYRLVRLLVLGKSQRLAAAIRADLGLEPLPGLFIGWPALVADKYIQASIPQLEYPRGDLPPSVVFVGTMPLDGVDDQTRPGWWDRVSRCREAGRPVVFVTQGSAITDMRQLLLPTVEALADEDMLVIGTTTGLDPQDVLPAHRRPGNLVLEPYIPFTEIIPLADVMITNGGLGGIQTALANGVPLVAAGKANDHMENNARVRWSRAGVTVRGEPPSAKAVGVAVRTVLEQPSFRARARELRSAYREYPDAAQRAARLILQAARTGA
jgi:UDP:flavonoid glycosyltransferase YjiC (YdhE family)